jgi:hypothetical protein
MTETNPNLEHTARIMFATLNRVYQLHEMVELEAEDETKLDGCNHCSAIAEAIVHYPCPTVQVLLEDMVVETTEPAKNPEAENEETPTE